MKRFLLYAALLTLTQCSSCKKDDPTPEDQLPPATQTGANTFGCLVDGQPWTPSGNDGTSNFRLTYDPGTAGGDLTIRAYRYVGNSQLQNIIVGGTRIAGPGNYIISENSTCGIVYYDATKSGGCKEYFYTNSGYRSRGKFIVTRLDLQAGIIAGTFEAKVVQTGCDTLRITQGRFDYKL